MSTILYAMAGYIFLTAMVRFLTRRPGAQLTQAEFVLLFLIGGVIILATAQGDRSMTNCCCAVITVASMHRLISRLKLKYPRLAQLLDGTPIVLVQHGEWKHDIMRGMRIPDDDVQAAARVKGVINMADIDYAILERNGAISIIRKEQSGSEEDD